jgi:hypothetical protein
MLHRAPFTRPSLALGLLLLVAVLPGCGSDDGTGPADAGDTTDRGDGTPDDAAADTAPPGVCGDDRVDPGEACDGADLDGYRCDTLGAGFAAGTLACRADCSGFDVAGCTAGNTIDAASCEQAEVTARLDAAADGDTVRIPAGTCTWTEPYELCKSVVLRGAGIDRTVLIDATPASDWPIAIPFLIQGCTDRTVRISSLTFRDADASDSPGTIFVRGDDLRFRFDHLAFEELASRAIHVNGRSWGVIDHCEFRRPSQLQLTADAGDVDGTGSWSEPMSWGTGRAVVVEDSVYVSDTAHSPYVTDCNYGGRYAFRRNTVTDGMVGNHGMDTVDRGCLQMEIYDNDFSSPGAVWIAIGSRGGSAVAFGNSIDGYEMPFGFTHYRSCCYVAPGICLDEFPTCDGTSPLDGNTEPRATYQGWPCKDQVGRGTNQSAEPVYQWDNTFEGAPAVVELFATWRNETTGAVCTSPHPTVHIQPGRDYFDGVPRPGYVPYVYPHPLVQVDP